MYSTRLTFLSGVQDVLATKQHVLNRVTIKYTHPGKNKNMSLFSRV